MSKPSMIDLRGRLVEALLKSNFEGGKVPDCPIQILAAQGEKDLGNARQHPEIIRLYLLCDQVASEMRDLDEKGRSSGLDADELEYRSLLEQFGFGVEQTMQALIRANFWSTGAHESELRAGWQVVASNASTRLGYEVTCGDFHGGSRIVMVERDDHVLLIG